MFIAWQIHNMLITIDINVSVLQIKDVQYFNKWVT